MLVSTKISNMSGGQKTRAKISSVNTTASPKPKAGHEIVQKPLIASLAGTTKAVSLSQRPTAPNKPRPEKKLSVGSSRPPARQDSGVLKGAFSTCADQSSSCKEQNLLDAVSCNDLAGSENSGQTEKVSGKTEALWEVCRHQTQGRSHTGGSGSSTAHSGKSSTELLMEARIIAGVERAGERDQQRATDLTRTDPSLKKSGHLNETIDLLQCQIRARTFFSCDQMEAEHGHSRSADCEGPTQRDPVLPQLNICPPEDMAVSSGVCKVTVSDPQRDSQLGCDDEELKNILPPVSNEDIIFARGRSLCQRAERRNGQNKTLQSLSLLATWKPKEDYKSTEGYKTIHHFCTTAASQSFPVELQLASKMCHTRTVSPASTHAHQQVAAAGQRSHPDIRRFVCEGVSAETGLSAHTDCVSHVSSDSLQDWQRTAEIYVERPRMMLCGRAATLCASELRIFWNPAPPKFICAPCVLKEHLFPQYQPEQHIENLRHDPHNVKCVPHVMVTQENVSSTESKSLSDLRTIDLASFTPSGLSTKEQARRPHSAPQLTPDPEPRLQLRSDFSSLSQELEHVRLKQQQQKSVCASLAGESSPSARQTESRDVLAGRGSSEQPCQAPNHRRKAHKHNKSSDVPRYKHRASKRAKKLGSVKMAYVRKKLEEPPRALKRCESLCQFPVKPKPSEGSSALIHLSLPHLLDFESFAVDRGGMPDTTSPRQWVADIWDAWFDEIFPPLENVQSTEEEKDKITDLDGVDLSEVLDEGLTKADLECEVAALTQAMTEGGNRSAFDLCRRGALHIKLGYLSRALEDLNAAISLEPYLLDAHWHRHRIHLLRNDPDRALEDLNIIIQNNGRHADAFMSRAEIYKERGEITAAVISYTQAIKAQPDNADVCFKRAQMYEKMGDTLLALKDYTKTVAIDSTRTDALMICGILHLRDSKWMTALENFSSLLKQEPGNAVARTYRGRICSKLGCFEEALEEFSWAVHLNPSDWLAFYHRGLLLRKIKPQMALRDLSTSVLINDSAENLRSFLQRGLLYTDLQLWREAVADFEAVIRLDRSVAVAHVSLGLINMLKMGRNHEAIRRFSRALKAEPTNIRVYLCRARAFHNVNNLNRAVRDLSRAIHMNPVERDLHLLRGQYLYEMGQFDLASRCIRYAANMKTALGLSPVQQAVIQSFLGNEAEVISCLAEDVDACPSLPALVLLGKTLMRKQRFTEAVERFTSALAMLGSSKTELCVHQTAEIFHLIGLCYMTQALLFQDEDPLLSLASDAFSSAVRVKSDDAVSYHQRGVCRACLRDPRSVQDFNTALHINPNLYQTHLCRSALYGAEGRPAQALLHCNEAIRIQPNSVTAFMWRGALKFSLKAYRSAVEDLSMAIKMDETCSFAHYNRGVCYQQLPDYELALRDYSTALLLGGHTEFDVKVLINRGLVYVEINDLNNALQDFKSAACKRPADALIQHTLGVIHHRLGQLEEAVDCYSKAIKLDPSSQDAYVGRGNVFMDYKHSHAWKQAQKDFLSALHLNPRCSNARIGLAYNLQVFGLFQRAWDQFTVQMEMDRKCWAAYEGRAVVSLQMGDTFAALQDINAAIQFNPLSALLLTNRGFIQQMMGDKSSAMRDYQKSISLSPRYALAHFNAATLFFYNGQFEQACEFYSKAFELDPSDESAVLNRAITYALLRKIPEALQDFSEALKLNPLSAQVFLNRANLLRSLRCHQSAEEDLTQALKLQPADALLYKLRADVRCGLGWTEEALEDYRTALELEDLQTDVQTSSRGSEALRDKSVCNQ